MIVLRSSFLDISNECLNHFLHSLLKNDFLIQVCQVNKPVAVSNVYFLVRDEKGKPLNLSAVSFLDQVKFTSSNGLVEFFDVPLDQYLPFSVYKSDYITVEDFTLLTFPKNPLFGIGYKDENGSMSPKLGLGSGVEIDELNN